MVKYSETTIRKKALEVGYMVEKGFQHYIHNNSVFYNCSGKRLTGYNLLNLSTNLYVWGCYNNNFDHLWSLEDVENYLIHIYKKVNKEY